MESAQTVAYSKPNKGIEEQSKHTGCLTSFFSQYFICPDSPISHPCVCQGQAECDSKSPLPMAEIAFLIRSLTEALSNIVQNNLKISLVCA